jgi:hypothetical protein
MKYLLILLVIATCGKTQETKPATPITSPVEDLAADYSRMPSYADPKKWSIVRFNGEYFIKYPGGSMYGDDKFPTAEAAQEEINARAATSRDKWIRTGGVDY